MHPHHIFGLDSFLLLLPLTVLLGTGLFLYLIRDEGYSAKQLFLLQLCLIGSALLGAKLYSLYLRDWQLLSPISREITSAWRYPGAILGIVLLMPFLKKLLIPQVSLLRCGDASVIVAAFAVGLIRINCLLYGCCTGAICYDSYCWRFARDSSVWLSQQRRGLIDATSELALPVLPLNFYFMFASFTVGGILLVYRRYQRFDGELILWFLILHEGSKAMLEILRVPHLERLQQISVTVALSAGIVLAVCLLLNQRNRSTKIQASAK